jgi:hypothetical protein
LWHPTGRQVAALGQHHVDDLAVLVNRPYRYVHRLKARHGPIRGLKSHRPAPILAAGHAVVQNLRRGHYDIATDDPGYRRPSTISQALSHQRSIRRSCSDSLQERLNARVPFGVFTMAAGYEKNLAVL